jgi:hypothetical protein
MVDGGRLPDSGENPHTRSTPTVLIADAFGGALAPTESQHDRKGVRGSDQGKPGNR